MNFRRYYVPNSVVFITQVDAGHKPVFQDQRYLHLLHATLRTVKTRHPFVLLAYVWLPDHFHLLLRPTGTSTSSQIMHALKLNFTKAYQQAAGQNRPLQFWPKRFWDHLIRDEIDLRQHLDYIHFNPVKHGLVNKPED